MARACRLFYSSKIIELLDTVFFILRKKQKQLTFLHVYHHSSAVLLFWIGARYVPGGNTSFVGSLNSFGHICMYSYYGLAAIGPQLQKYLWWKRYITKAQLVQFIMISGHGAMNIYMRCDYSPVYTSLVSTFAASLLFLFLHFYYQSFMNKNDSQRIR